MKKFMDKDFLLTTPAAQSIFEKFAKDTPIFDWHCHLSAKEIYENKAPNDIYELWLSGDHYKWRAMRSCGTDEKFVTGDGEPYEKFLAFAKTLTLAIGNPLFHWSHLELQRYFGIEEVLNEDTAKAIWDKTKEIIANGDFRPQSLIERSNVYALCTTDDPCDSLEYHEKIKESGFSVKVLPAFRPDKAIAIENDGFAEWVANLGKAAGMEIKSYAELCEALEKRIEFFIAHGCVASDQSMAAVPLDKATDEEVDSIFKKALSLEKLSETECNKYKLAVLTFLAKKYAENNLAMELHLGAMRNNNAAMFNSIGPDTGFDSIDDPRVAQGLSRFLDSLNVEGKLPKTILFNLNPKDNFVLGSMLGNFQSSEAKSKIQFGSAWWFNDNIDGMTAQIKALGNLGVLGCFVGMVTDSRSFLSYPRHEYFRRILCGIIGEWVENGLYPYDEKALKTIVEGVSFFNSKEYFLNE